MYYSFRGIIKMWKGGKVMWQTFREALEVLVNLTALYMMLKPNRKAEKPRNRKPRKQKR